jgi:hypothetical protein
MSEVEARATQSQETDETDEDKEKESKKKRSIMASFEKLLQSRRSV